MDRILIIGCGGAGKTTLANQLARHLGHRVIHLDQYFWNSGWQETPADKWNVKVRQLVAGNRWIMDGNYGGTLDMRANAADTIVFLDYNTWICLWGILWRRVRYHGRSRPSLPEGCPERVNFEFLLYVLNYRRTRRPGILQQLEKYRAGGKNIFIFGSRQEAGAWLESFSQLAEKL